MNAEFDRAAEEMRRNRDEFVAAIKRLDVQLADAARAIDAITAAAAVDPECRGAAAVMLGPHCDVLESVGRRAAVFRASLGRLQTLVDAR